MKIEHDLPPNSALNKTAVMQSVIVNELRIGNLVEFFGVREVIAIKKHKIKVQNESKRGNFIIEWCPITSLYLEAINISEKLLLSFGFTEVDYAGGCFTKDDITIDMADLNCCYKKDWLEIDVKSIHQLQNIYFSLMGRELTVA